MSEQVQCMSAQEWAERAPTRRMVLEDDYAALHAEAEVLRADNGRLLRAAQTNWNEFTDGVGETAKLRTELEAARGLLERVTRDVPQLFGHPGLLSEIDAFLAAHRQAQQGGSHDT